MKKNPKHNKKIEWEWYVMRRSGAETKFNSKEEADEFCRDAFFNRDIFYQAYKRRVKTPAPVGISQPTKEE